VKASEIEVMELKLPAKPIDVKRRIRTILKNAKSQEEFYRLAFCDRELVSAIWLPAITRELMELAGKAGKVLMHKETGEVLRLDQAAGVGILGGGSARLNTRKAHTRV
jgi:hypothetical protein